MRTKIRVIPVVAGAFALLLFAFVENIMGLWIVVIVYALLSGKKKPGDK